MTSLLFLTRAIAFQNSSAVRNCCPVCRMLVFWLHVCVQIYGDILLWFVVESAENTGRCLGSDLDCRDTRSVPYCAYASTLYAKTRDCAKKRHIPCIETCKPSERSPCDNWPSLSTGNPRDACTKPHPHSKQRQPDCPTHGVVNPLSSGHLAHVRSSSFQTASISASCSSRRWPHPARRHRRHRPCGDPSCFFALPSSSSETSIRHSAPR